MCDLYISSQIIGHLATSVRHPITSRRKPFLSYSKPVCHLGTWCFFGESQTSCNQLSPSDINESFLPGLWPFNFIWPEWKFEDSWVPTWHHQQFCAPSNSFCLDSFWKLIVFKTWLQSLWANFRWGEMMFWSIQKNILLKKIIYITFFLILKDLQRQNNIHNIIYNDISHLKGLECDTYVKALRNCDLPDTLFGRSVVIWVVGRLDLASIFVNFSTTNSFIKNKQQNHEIAGFSLGKACSIHSLLPCSNLYQYCLLRKGKHKSHVSFYNSNILS